MFEIVDGQKGRRRTTGGLQSNWYAIVFAQQYDLSQVSESEDHRVLKLSPTRLTHITIFHISLI